MSRTLLVLFAVAIGIVSISDAAATELGRRANPPSMTGGHLSEGMPAPIQPIGDLGTDISPPKGRLPTDYANSALPAGPVEAPQRALEGAWTAYRWTAPGTCHRPLYFENPSLERHGYSLGIAQPLASAALFVGDTAILPYRLVSEPTRDCVYTLGHERPGTPTPLRYYRPPFSVAAGMAQAGTVTGLIFLIP